LIVGFVQRNLTRLLGVGLRYRPGNSSCIHAGVTLRDEGLVTICDEYN
jgi:hypothetical protein